eukprot:3026015-Rhodomonas_salina.1
MFRARDTQQITWQRELLTCWARMYSNVRSAALYCRCRAHVSSSALNARTKCGCGWSGPISGCAGTSSWTLSDSNDSKAARTEVLRPFTRSKKAIDAAEIWRFPR